MQCNDDRYDDDQNDKQATSPHILQQSASFVCSQILTFFEIWLPTEILPSPSNLSTSHLLTFIQSEKMMRCAGAYRRNVFVRCQLHWSVSVCRPHLTLLQ